MKGRETPFINYGTGARVRASSLSRVDKHPPLWKNGCGDSDSVSATKFTSSPKHVGAQSDHDGLRGAFKNLKKENT